MFGPVAAFGRFGTERRLASDFHGAAVLLRFMRSSREESI